MSAKAVSAVLADSNSGMLAVGNGLLKPYSTYLKVKKPNLPGWFRLVEADGKFTDGLYIKEVMYNDPATIVMWSDGTKTVAKCNDDDEYDKEKGLMVCILKRIMGTGDFISLMDSWVPAQQVMPGFQQRQTLKNVRYNNK